MINRSINSNIDIIKIKIISCPTKNKNLNSSIDIKKQLIIIINIFRRTKFSKKKKKKKNEESKSILHHWAFTTTCIDEVWMKRVYVVRHKEWRREREREREKQFENRLSLSVVEARIGTVRDKGSLSGPRLRI